MEYLSDYEDSIVSQKLESLPEEKGFAVYGKNKGKKELNLLDTYSGDEVVTNYLLASGEINHLESGENRQS
jgi:hypothetical protein